METEINFFTENVADNAMFEVQQSYFNLQNFNTPDPGDEEENEDEDKDEDTSDDAGTDTANDDPPLDKDVVHSPLPTRTGGKPK